MTRFHLLNCLFVTGMLATIGCNNRPTTGGGDSATTKSAAPVEIGNPLYKEAALPKIEAMPPKSDPIVIPEAVVQHDQLTQVSASVDATIELIATPLEPGAPFDPKDPKIVFHPRDVGNPKTAYRILGENDTVTKDQILVRFDEQLVAKQIEMNANLVESNKKIIAKNKEAVVAYEKILTALEATKGTAPFEIYQNQANVARLTAEMIQAEREMVKAHGDMDLARVQLARYWLRSPINGRIVRKLKRPGEFAKTGEAVLEIQATDRVRVEGRLDVQYANLLRRGMKVVVESARPVGPQPIANFHRQEVTSIAVTAHPGRPLVVSGGLDDSALVWDVTNTKRSHRLPHPAGVGVRTVTTTTDAKSKLQLVATGGADGKVRIWDVSNPEKLPTEPWAVFPESHASAVTCSAFSPDGRYLATSANRDIILWDVSEKKKLYALPSEHSDAVTCLRFTPQCTLMTAARDRSIRFWKVGDKAAASSSPISHRGGTVDVLGISKDGSRILFDKDANRIDVVALADERSIGTLQSPSTATRFSTLAMFSSDDKLVVTANSEGALTVWQAPQDAGAGRWSERLRLLTPNGTTTTCAAISPDPEKRFLAVGTNTGGVYFWDAAVSGESAKPMTGEVVAVLPADARSVQVRVEMENPIDPTTGEGLQDRSLATIIVNPDGAVPTVPRVVTAPVPTNPIVPAAAVGADPSNKVVTADVPGKLPSPLVPVLPANALVVPALPIPTAAVVPAEPNPKK